VDARQQGQSSRRSGRAVHLPFKSSGYFSLKSAQETLSWSFFHEKVAFRSFSKSEGWTLEIDE
jgi:hypothetical protein